MKKNSKNGLPASQPASQRGTAEATLISRAKVNDTTFRILITGSQDALPILAKEMKKCIMETHNISQLKIHHAITLNEEIAMKLSKDGLHAVVICTDTSQVLCRSNMTDTIKHLGFDLLCGSLFILNLVKPLPAVFASLADAVDKLAIAYNITIIHIHLEDKQSVAHGVGRISTAALLAAKFIPGVEPPTLKNIDFNQFDDSAI